MLKQNIPLSILLFEQLAFFRHDILRDTTTTSLSEVCKDVKLESTLAKSIGKSEGILDVRVFNPKAKRYEKQNEREKKRFYNERVQKGDQVSIAPLVFSANDGGYDIECLLPQRLTNTLAEKKGNPWK